MPKIVDREERRRAIASAAVDAIAAQGLDGVKLADIADAAGVTTGAVAHYFRDKDAVLAAALEEACTRLLIRIGLPDNAPSVSEIAAALPVTPENRAEWRVWLAFWGRAPHAPALRAIHRRHYEDIEAAVAEDMAGLHGSPRWAAAAIIAAVDGVGVRATLDPEDWPAERQVAMLEALIGPLIASLKPGKPEGA